MNKYRRRSSIHDITSVNNGDVSTPQGPITGQTNGSSGNPTNKSVKQAIPPRAGIPGAGIYAAPSIGLPIGGLLVFAVGTPVNLSGSPHTTYGIRAPVPGTVAPGAPMNMVPMTYPMPHTSGPHR
ncbi:transcription factor SRM1-like [Vicia villosa]|uniref:transcription factor SRM1-like n=1 Tax=Vicia villosa TaxID=3911 RepID=UPI00273B6877|nr:transcription factor SRM1-like [Vicia villosa]